MTIAMPTKVLEQTEIETAVSPRPAEEKWPPQGQWTYEDYKSLPDDGWRYEVIEEVTHARH